MPRVGDKHYPYTAKGQAAAKAAAKRKGVKVSHGKGYNKGGSVSKSRVNLGAGAPKRKTRKKRAVKMQAGGAATPYPADPGGGGPRIQVPAGLAPGTLPRPPGTPGRRRVPGGVVGRSSYHSDALKALRKNPPPGRVSVRGPGMKKGGGVKKKKGGSVKK